MTLKKGKKVVVETSSVALSVTAGEVRASSKAEKKLQQAEAKVAKMLANIARG